MRKHSSALLVIAAGTLWGIISIFMNIMSRFGFSSAEIAFLRALTCAVMLLLFLLIYDSSLLKIRLRDAWMFVGTGVISVTFFSYLYFTTVRNNGASVAVSLLYTSPVFVMLLSALIFQERITVTNCVAVALMVTGCALISSMLGGGAGIGLHSLLTGIGSGLFYALYSIFGRFATRRYHSLTITFYTFAFASVGFFLIIHPIDTLRALGANPAALLPMLLMSFFCGFLPYLFYTIGLKSLDTTVAGILVAVEPLVGNLVGLLLFHESAGTGKLIGIALMLTAIVLLNVKTGKKSDE